MATVQITIPDALVSRVEDAFAATYNYPAQVDDGAGNMIQNPQTTAQFVRAKLKDYVREVVKAHEVNVAADAARDAKATEVEGLGL